VVPPFTHGRTLIYRSPKADGRIGFGYHIDNLVSLYDAEPDQVTAALGGNWEDLPPDAFQARLQGFRELMLQLLAPTDEVDSEVEVEAHARCAPRDLLARTDEGRSAVAPRLPG
jgi:hypothetical protein